MHLKDLDSTQSHKNSKYFSTFYKYKRREKIFTSVKVKILSSRKIIVLYLENNSAPWPNITAGRALVLHTSNLFDPQHHISSPKHHQGWSLRTKPEENPKHH